MGTEELRAAVLQEATAEAASIIEAATAEASQLVDSQRRQLEKHNGTLVAERRASRDHDIVTQTAALKIELRNAILKRKQELLEGVYQELEQKVRGDTVLYHAYLERAVERVGAEAPISIECRSVDESVVRGLLLKRADWSGVRIDASLPDTDGGFVAHFAEAELDLTLSGASVAMREDTLVETAQALFGDTK
ncbi:MAG TPA: V-type ATP synthase subunit E family protein [Clostridia bacterium]|nr:V-type ATP synthase subunit E family protein [Clostridia bacterium]